MKTFGLIFGLLLYFVSITGFHAQSFEETTFPEITTTPSASRSANFVDINGDGWDDIFFSNGPTNGQKNLLYINNKNGTFSTITTDDIVNELGRSDGVSFADVDNDGDVDCFEVTYGFGSTGRKNYFYRNNGDGSFTYEPTIAMGLPLTFSEMCTWIDANNDNFLDLYFTNSNGSLANLYYENQTDGSFLQVTSLPITSENLLSRSINWIDYDGDGDSDLFIANEDNANNSLFRNDGPNTFTQITNIEITQNGKTSAGSSWADIDNDGDFDLFAANWEGQNNQLFINDGGIFTEQTTSIIASGGGNSFGSSFGDMDNDGDLDLFVCNAYFTGQTQNFVYLNDGSGNFTQDTSSTLAAHSGYTFGCAFGDYDKDGWLDIILANTLNENQNNSLYHNTGTGSNWITILCKGNPSNASAVGAKVKLRANINGTEVSQTRQIVASSGYCSQNSYTSHFGLGNATGVEEVEIQWPSGTIETYPNLQVNGHYIAEEGNGISLGIGNNELPKSLIVYPVPSDHLIRIEFSEIISNTIKAELFDINSRKVKEKTMNPSSEMEIDVSDMGAGSYVLRIINGGNVYSKNIIIE